MSKWIIRESHTNIEKLSTSLTKARCFLESKQWQRAFSSSLYGCPPPTQDNPTNAHCRSHSRSVIPNMLPKDIEKNDSSFQVQASAPVIPGQEGCVALAHPPTHMILQGQSLVPRLLHSVSVSRTGNVWRGEESQVGYKKQEKGQVGSRLCQAAATALPAGNCSAGRAEVTGTRM